MGFSDLTAKPANFWKEAAARLVDAQATGLAAQVRQLENVANSGAGLAGTRAGAHGQSAIAHRCAEPL